MPHFEFFDPRFGDMKIVRRVPTKPFDGDDTQPIDPLEGLIDVTDWQRGVETINDHSERYARVVERLEQRRLAHKPSLLWRVIAWFRRKV